MQANNILQYASCVVSRLEELRPTCTGPYFVLKFDSLLSKAHSQGLILQKNEKQEAFQKKGGGGGGGDGEGGRKKKISDED